MPDRFGACGWLESTAPPLIDCRTVKGIGAPEIATGAKHLRLRITVMVELHVFDDVLKANAEYADTFAMGGLEPVAARGLGIVNCMDSRIEPFAARAAPRRRQDPAQRRRPEPA